MKRIVTALAAVSAFALAAPAFAATEIITPITPVLNPAPGEYLTFFVSGNIFSGPITATIGHTGIPTGPFTDLYRFIIPQTGVGSGGVTTTVNIDNILGATDLDFTSVLVNGVAATLTLTDASGTVCTVPNVGTCGANETYSANNVPITALTLNTITVNGTSRGLGSYGGNLTFVPSAVPEPATWAMMLVGFGAMGFSLRSKRRSSMRRVQAV